MAIDKEGVGIARQQESRDNSLNHFFGSDPRAVSEKIIPAMFCKDF